MDLRASREYRDGRVPKGFKDPLDLQVQEPTVHKESKVGKELQDLEFLQVLDRIPCRCL